MIAEIIRHGNKYGYNWFIVHCTVCNFESPLLETTETFECPECKNSTASTDTLYRNYTEEPTLNWDEPLDYNLGME